MSQRTDLEKTIDFMLFCDPEGRLDPAHIDKMRDCGSSPQTLLDIVADQMEELGTRQTLEFAERLRTGEGDKHVAARLGYA